MKPEVYNSLAVINQATEQIARNIEILRDEGVLTPHFAEIRILSAQENCAETNVSVVHKLTERESEDAIRIQKERGEKESRLTAT